MQKLMHQCIKSGILSDGNISGPFCTAESAAALVFEQRSAGKYAGRQAVVVKPGVNQECCGIYLLTSPSFVVSYSYSVNSFAVSGQRTGSITMAARPCSHMILVRTLPGFLTASKQLMPISR